MPARIQRQRTKGWRMPAGAVYVGRPSRWSNPWRVVDEHRWGNGWVVLDPDFISRPQRHYCSSSRVARRYAAWRFRHWCATGFGPDVADLSGRDLACWCPLASPCHADVLLELANGGSR